jgi:hypothetical protein
MEVIHFILIVTITTDFHIYNKLFFFFISFKKISSYYLQIIYTSINWLILFYNYGWWKNNLLTNSHNTFFFFFN